MQLAEQTTPLTWKSAAARGAAVGVGLTLAYVVFFVVYASLRSTLSILQVGEVDAGVLPTILATIAALVWTSLVAGLLFGILAAGLGAASAVLIFWALGAFNWTHSANRAILFGVGVTVVIALLLYFGMGQALDLTMTPSSSQAVGFWLAIPLLIYIVAGGIGGWVLNSYSASREKMSAIA